MAGWRLFGLGCAAVLAVGCMTRVRPQYLYVAHDGPPSLSAFSLNPLSGALTRIDANPTTPQVDDFPSGIGSAHFVAVHPSRKYLYVTNNDAKSVSVYSVSGASGRLARMDADPTTAAIDDFATGGTPMSIAV